MTWYWRLANGRQISQTFETELNKIKLVRWGWRKWWSVPSCERKMLPIPSCKRGLQEMVDGGNGGLSPVASDDMTVSATSSVTVTSSPVTDHHCYSICCLRTQGWLTSSRCGHCVHWTVSKWSKPLVSAILIRVSLIRPLAGSLVPGAVFVASFPAPFSIFCWQY